jgi:carboxymethylenebutenolidase
MTSELATADITIKTATCAGGLPVYAAVPSGSTRRPVLIVMHERYGFTDEPMKSQTERFAREGFVCVAPDFFFKHADQKALHAGDTTYEMTDPESIGYFDAVVAWLKAEVPQADLDRLCIMGVCQTGRHPLVYASRRPLAAALVWYGAAQPREFKVSDRYPVPLEDLIAKIDCPVLGQFGEADHIISIGDIRRLRGALEQHGKRFTINIYRDAPHGWLNYGMPGRYRKDIAERALADQRDFLREVLAPDFDRARIVQRWCADVSDSYDFSANKRQA